MNKTTLNALEESIQKWENIINNKKEDNGPKDCILCILFRIDTHYGISCENCPIAIATLADGCDGSPYEEWYNYCNDKGEDLKIFDDESERLAKIELEFLKSIFNHQKVKNGMDKY